MFELIFVFYTVANSNPAALSAMNPIIHGIYASLSDCQTAAKSISVTQVYGPGIGNLEIVAVCAPKSPANQ